ncbi:hypothetical protein B0H15DRAFT_944665 [Mycena belliarum]|uniref:F-box domain-containing protein n=1 Tax=Mycena belliarum TaxID=1033014 RepID=A0AAD6UHF9_9AGAR|nr:hypothetical protein B0H15DRAFT_944665 [Mycena belliae]
MPLSRRLTRSVRRRLSFNPPRGRKGVPPDALLPLELWNCIFLELPDDPLLQVSATCRTFNALCMAMYFLREGITSDSLASGDLAVASRLIKPLQLSLFIPPIACLSCDFWSRYYHAEHLACLRSLLRSSHSIKRLEMIFAQDLFISVYQDPLLKPFDRESVLNLFRDVVYSMSRKFNGPAIVVNPFDIFTCRPRDIAHWEIHRHHLGGGLRDRLRDRLTNPFRTQHPSHTMVRLHDGTHARVDPFRSITTAHIYEIPSLTQRANASSTLIVINHEHITYLVLGYVKRSIRHSPAGAELSVILPWLTLPALHAITLRTDSIDSAVLSQFLARQRSLQCIEYVTPRSTTHTAPLVAPALAHPALARLSATDPANLLRLLDAVGASPQLASFDFAFDRASPDMQALLRRLAQHRTHASAPHPQRAGRPRVAGRRRACRGRLARRDAARGVLPWLTLLPGLLRLDCGFPSDYSDAGVEAQAAFLREARLALPGVEVDASLFE